MPELSILAKNLISQYQKPSESKESQNLIRVDEFASKVAAFYEKIREIVDWKEEHLIRRAAIIRKLKRRFLELSRKEAVKTENMAEPLVLELVRGGHFDNNRIPETKTQEVQKVINKYIFVIKNFPNLKNKREKLQLFNWLIEISACEIEEALAPPVKETALMEAMYSAMKERIKLNEGIIAKHAISEQEKNIQIYIAVQKALFKLDSPIISYNLLKKKYPDWNKAKSEWLVSLPEKIYSIWKEIEKDLDSPYSGKFYAVCEKYDTPFLLLGDVLSEGVLENIEDPENLESLIRKAYNKRLSTLKIRLLRAAFYSTLSIFIANIFSIIVLEIPLAKLITGSFSPFAIFVDIFVPTLLMFLLTITAKTPPKSNFNVVLQETNKIVYQTGKQDAYEIKIRRKKGLLLWAAVSILYAFGAFITLGIVFIIFQAAKLPPTSIIIHILLIALVAFTGLAIRKRAEELTIADESISFFDFILDISLLPVAGFGRWLSVKWKKYNAVSAFFNALIDMPFLTFIEFIEKWRYYIKEKKEEIQ